MVRSLPARESLAEATANNDSQVRGTHASRTYFAIGGWKTVFNAGGVIFDTICDHFDLGRATIALV